MPQMGFEPTIPVLERAKRVHALRPRGHCDRRVNRLHSLISQKAELFTYLFFCLHVWNLEEPFVGFSNHKSACISYIGAYYMIRPSHNIW
jgi:hypothetical protein